MLEIASRFIIWSVMMVRFMVTLPAKCCRLHWGVDPSRFLLLLGVMLTEFAAEMPISPNLDNLTKTAVYQGQWNTFNPTLAFLNLPKAPNEH